ncbi:BPTI/Kunitz domain-containing protein [Heptranchias perlo]|uniref:BPTI/Kunitz domain-containing protein n=1 Tax=Heptranchias perlo TaxID=212740 RepID=UPI00355A0E50
MWNLYTAARNLGLIAIHFIAFTVGQRPSACDVPMDEGQLGDNPSMKFYYNAVTDHCNIFAYRGAGGNANRFFTDKYCMKNCSRIADEVYPDDDRACLLPVDAGDCKGRLLLFYFDSSKKKCKPFLYGGCGGNGNRFILPKICNSFCASKMGGPPGDADEESEVDEGLAVGLGMGCAVLLILAVALALFFTQKKKRAKRQAAKHHQEPLNKGIEMS